MRAAGGKTTEITPHPDDSVRVEAEALTDDLELGPRRISRPVGTNVAKEAMFSARRLPMCDSRRCGYTATAPLSRWYTNCAHIVPLSLGDGKSNETTVAMIWVAILPEATILPRHTGNKDSAKWAQCTRECNNHGFNSSRRIRRFDFSIVSLSRTSSCIYILTLHMKEKMTYLMILWQLQEIQSSSTVPD